MLLGTYSQGVKAGSVLFIYGQLPIKSCDHVISRDD